MSSRQKSSWMRQPAKSRMRSLLQESSSPISLFIQQLTPLRMGEALSTNFSLDWMISSYNLQDLKCLSFFSCSEQPGEQKYSTSRFSPLLPKSMTAQLRLKQVGFDPSGSSGRYLARYSSSYRMKGMSGNPFLRWQGCSFWQTTWKELFPSSLQRGTPQKDSLKSMKACQWPQYQAEKQGMYSKSCWERRGFMQEKLRYWLREPQSRSWMEQSWWWERKMVEPGNDSILCLCQASSVFRRRGPRFVWLIWSKGLASWQAVSAPKNCHRLSSLLKQKQEACCLANSSELASLTKHKKGSPQEQQSWFPGMLQNSSCLLTFILNFLRNCITLVSYSSGVPAQQTSPRWRMTVTPWLTTMFSSSSQLSGSPVPQSPMMPTLSVCVSCFSMTAKFQAGQSTQCSLRPLLSMQLRQVCSRVVTKLMSKLEYFRSVLAPLDSAFSLLWACFSSLITCAMFSTSIFFLDFFSAAGTSPSPILAMRSSVDFILCTLADLSTELAMRELSLPSNSTCPLAPRHCSLTLSLSKFISCWICPQYSWSSGDSWSGSASSQTQNVGGRSLSGCSAATICSRVRERCCSSRRVEWRKSSKLLQSCCSCTCWRRCWRRQSLGTRKAGQFLKLSTRQNFTSFFRIANHYNPPHPTLHFHPHEQQDWADGVQVQWVAGVSSYNN